MKEQAFTDRPLGERESLELIARMIRNTQKKLERGSGWPFLVWGYATLFATAAVCTMLYLTGDYRWNFLWFLIPAIGGPLMMLKWKKEVKTVRTYVDTVVSNIWTVFGIVGFLVSAFAIFVPVPTPFPILFIVVLLMGSGVTLTGLVVKFRPLVVSGALGILISFSFFFITSTVVYLAMFALDFVVMMIIPGHYLNYKAKKNNDQYGNND